MMCISVWTNASTSFPRKIMKFHPKTTPFQTLLHKNCAKSTYFFCRLKILVLWYACPPPEPSKVPPPMKDKNQPPWQPVSTIPHFQRVPCTMHTYICLYARGISPDPPPHADTWLRGIPYKDYLHHETACSGTRVCCCTVL